MLFGNFTVKQIIEVEFLYGIHKKMNIHLKTVNLLEASRMLA